eukprot:g492.t1
MDENDILVTVVPAKGGIVLMSRMMLEWSWRCNMCMGMELSPHKSVPLNETGKGYWPPYEIDTPKHDSDILLAATLMKKWNHYARTQSDRVRCVVVTRDPIDRLRSHHTYTMSDGDYDLRELGLKMKQATSTGDALEIMWNRMARESMIRSHEYLTSALSLGCKQIRFEGFRENFNETVHSIFRAWNINPEVQSDLMDIAVTHDLGRLSQKELNSNHHVNFKVYPPAPGWNTSSGVPPPPPPSEDIPKSLMSKKKSEEKSSGDEFDIAGIQEKTLRTIFTLLDSDQDKLLDVDQLRTAIIAMGIPPAPRLIQDIVRNVPSRFKNKGVDFDTFKAVITDRLRSNPVKMSDIEELFKSFESGHDGVVSDVSLRHIMEVQTTNKTNLTDDEVDEIFEELGIRRKDPINYRDFMNKISSGFVNFA